MGVYDSNYRNPYAPFKLTDLNSSGLAHPNSRTRYEATRDPTRMMNHSLLNETIQRDWSGIKGALPCKTATYLEYKAGATKARVWNIGERPIIIDLPLANGWYVSDGKPFALPNGRPGNRDEPGTLYLFRHQDRDFSDLIERRIIFYEAGKLSSDRGNLVYVAWKSPEVAGAALVGR